MLAIHGAMGGYDQGQILVRTIGEPGYRYIAVSHPGYLGTPLTAGRTPEEQADLYADLLDGLGIRETAVMAISGGDPSAIQFALRHRDRCWGLVLISTCAGKVDTPIPLWFQLMKMLFRWPAFVAMMQRRTAKDLERALRRSIADPILRARTVQDPHLRPLIKEVLVGVFDPAFSGTARNGKRYQNNADDYVPAGTDSSPCTGRAWRGGSPGPVHAAR